MGRILKAGSSVRVGFLLNTEYFSVDYENTVLPDLEGCLYDTGQFSSVEFFLERGNVFARDVLIVVATTAADFADYEDYGGLVAQQIQLCAPSLYISERKPVLIDDEPDATKTDPNVAHVNNQEGKGPSRQPGQCDGLGFFDYLSCQTGLNKSTVGIGLPVLAISGLVVLAIFLRR